MLLLCFYLHFFLLQKFGCLWDSCTSRCTHKTSCHQYDCKGVDGSQFNHLSAGDITVYWRMYILYCCLYFIHENVMFKRLKSTCKYDEKIGIHINTKSFQFIILKMYVKLLTFITLLLYEHSYVQQVKKVNMGVIITRLYRLSYSCSVLITIINCITKRLVLFLLSTNILCNTR